MGTSENPAWFFRGVLIYYIYAILMQTDRYMLIFCKQLTAHRVKLFGIQYGIAEFNSVLLVCAHKSRHHNIAFKLPFRTDRYGFGAHHCRYRVAYGELFIRIIFYV